MTKENLTSFHARYDDVDSAIKSLLNFMFFFFSVLVYCAKTRYTLQLAKSGVGGGGCRERFESVRRET
jgi:hypothetical protein